MFVLPDQMPATVAELDELARQARAEINVIQARHAAHLAGTGEELTREDVAQLRTLLDAETAIDTARQEAAGDDEAHRAEVDELLARANPAPAEAPADPAPAADAAPEPTEDEVAAGVAEAEAAANAQEPALAAAGAPSMAAS